MFVNPDEEILEQMMDDAAWHLESIREKQLPVSYTHLDVYKRQDWKIDTVQMRLDGWQRVGL